jgi:hypothetical protein
MFTTRNIVILLIGIAIGATLVTGLFFFSFPKENEHLPKSPTPTAIPDEIKVSSPTPTTASQSGTIEGALSFPSEGIPENMEVCAESMTGSPVACTKEHIKSSEYTYGEGYKLSVPPGEYYVYASIPDFNNGYKAYYNEFVKCGLSVDCPSHDKIAVTVPVGETVKGIDPQDWY